MAQWAEAQTRICLVMTFAVCSVFTERAINACELVQLIKQSRRNTSAPQTNTCFCRYTTSSILSSFRAILGCHMITSMSLLLWLHALPLTHSKAGLPSATLHDYSLLQSNLLLLLFSLYSSRSITHHNSTDKIGMLAANWKRPVYTDAQTFMAAG